MMFSKKNGDDIIVMFHLKAPSSLCDALEDHLKALESNKKSGVSAPAPKLVTLFPSTIH